MTNEEVVQFLLVLIKGWELPCSFSDYPLVYRTAWLLLPWASSQTSLPSVCVYNGFGVYNCSSAASSGSTFCFVHLCFFFLRVYYRINFHLDRNPRCSIGFYVKSGPISHPASDTRLTGLLVHCMWYVLFF